MAGSGPEYRHCASDRISVLERQSPKCSPREEPFGKEAVSRTESGINIVDGKNMRSCSWTQRSHFSSRYKDFHSASGSRHYLMHFANLARLDLVTTLIDDAMTETRLTNAINHKVDSKAKFTYRFEPHP